MELILDERIPVSQSATVLKNTGAFAGEMEGLPAREVGHPNIKTEAATSFHFWWLLLFPAVLLAIGLGWLIGHYSNLRRSPQKQVFVRHSIARKGNVLTEKTVREKNERRTLKRRQHVRKKQVSADDMFDFSDLNKAYNCHRFGRHDDMMEIMHKAFKHDPFDLNIYILSMTMLSESDEPSSDLTRLLKTGLFLLRTKRPFLWQEIAEKGRDLMPDLEDWSWAPE